MIASEEITNTFFYFRLFLTILSVVSYFVVKKRASPFWIKQSMGAEVLVIVLSIFNVVFLLRQLGLAIAWDVLNIVLAVFLLFKISKMKTILFQSSSFLSALFSISFWLLGLLYLILFPIGFTPLK